MKRFGWLAVLWPCLIVGCSGDVPPSELPPTELVQSGCAQDEDCPGGRCIVGIGEGLCTANCTVQEDCPDGTICTDTEAMDGVCLLSCENSAACKDHLGNAYNCDSESSFTADEDVRVCIDGR